MKLTDRHCIHCGAKLDEHYHVNPWLPGMAYQCPLVRGGVPACKEGQRWYQDWTRFTMMGRVHVKDWEGER
jgi:hypothetical protein